LTYHTLEGNFKASNSGEDLVGLQVRIVVGDKLAIDFEINPCLRYLIDEHQSPWSLLLDSLGHYSKDTVMMIIFNKNHL
jgi:hypothetical protein